MASSLIHIAVAKELNKDLKRDRSKMLIGTIAPDISKLIGETKIKSHFQDAPDNIPNLDKFLNKYKQNLNDDFVLGYYIHLFTDYLWFKYFIPDIRNKDLITELDGKVLKLDQKTFCEYVYNDYTDLNMKIIDAYDLDLKIFYNEIPQIDNIIEEIPMDKLYIIVNKAGEIIENSKQEKEFLFNLENVEQFVKFSTEIISENIKELNL